jgi:hypothetical protein
MSLSERLVTSDSTTLCYKRLTAIKYDPREIILIQTVQTSQVIP